MALDPLTGLDPTAPATTLRKDVKYDYVPPPAPPGGSSPSAYESGGVNDGTVGYTYYLVDENGNQRAVTFAEYAAATRLFG